MVLQSAGQSGAVHQGGQDRHQMDEAAPRTPAEVRAWVIEHTSVLENVARMADGKRIKACGPTGKPIWRETSADKQQQAIFKLLGKLAPDLTYGSITNVDARTAIKVEAEPSKPALPDFELARRLQLFASRENPEPREQRLNGTSAPKLIEQAAPEPPEAPEESLEPTAPEPGAVVEFIESGLAIHGFEGDRPGLPNIYETRDAAGRMVNRGAFDLCLAQVRKQADGDPGPWHVEEAQAPLGMAHVSRAEQQPAAMALPAVQHGYGHRKRRS